LVPAGVAFLPMATLSGLCRGPVFSGVHAFGEGRSARNQSAWASIST